MLDRFARAFPLWITLGSLLAIAFPPSFAWFIHGGLVTPGLQIIMLSMGLTLTMDDFRRVGRSPGLIGLGVALQYTLMPAIGFVVGHLLALPPALRAGLVLVCCCPGGTASNVITFLARADVALSVSMTAVSTLLAAIATPTLTALLIGASVEMDVVALFRTTALVVLLPVGVGLALRRFAPRWTNRALGIAPSLAVLFIVLIVGGIVAVRRSDIIDAGPRLLAAVVLAHGLAFLLAYVVTGLVRGFGSAARTISIEVGMQNSGLGVVLARASFPDPLVAVTPAVSAVIHCLYGSAVASFWSRRPPASEVEVATAPSPE